MQNSYWFDYYDKYLLTYTPKNLTYFDVYERLLELDLFIMILIQKIFYTFVKNTIFAFVLHI